MKYLLLLLLSANSYAMSFGQAQQIYRQVAIANGINAPALVLNKDSEVNAETGLFSITVNSGMLRYVRNADEMALVLGHELAHFTLGHRGSTPSRELAADSLGAKYSDTAGYNHCRGALALYRLHSAGGKTHPSSDLRYARLRCYTGF